MTVFANGREISAEAQGCKVIADFPDTCFTPPENPATPPGVPVPYPNFGVDSDLKSGSGTVKIGNKPISQENSSYYSKCTGDEAGAAAKKGLITSTNTGKIYAQGWSSDVKVESKGVARLGDMATSNHASNTGDGPPTAIVGKPDFGMFGDPNCLIGSYEDIVANCNKRKDANGDAYEAHHIIPDYVYRLGERGGTDRMDTKTFPTEESGFAICLPRDQHRGGKARVPESVHGNLDKKLRDLGRAVDTPGSPADTMKIKIIRKECIAAVAKLMPKWISLGCLKEAAKEVVAQTTDTADMAGKTKNRPLGPKDQAARNFLKGQTGAA